MGSAGTIIVWDGADWTTPVTRAGDHLAVWGTPGQWYVTGDYAQLWKYESSSWVAVCSSTGTYYDISGTGTSQVMMVGALRSTFRYTGSCNGVERSGIDFFAIFCLPTSIYDNYFIGESGFIGIVDSGQNITNEDSGGTEHLYDVWATSGELFWVVGQNGVILYKQK